MLIEPADVTRFRTIVAGRLGLRLDDGADTLRRLVALYGGSCDAYLDWLAAAPPAETPALATALTVGETYFFRHVEQFRAMVDIVGPAPRILSAGCASGEEAYTVAMVLREHRPEPAGAASIVGVDVNPDALRAAQRGRYARWALRATPPPMHRRWFHPDGDRVVLDEEIRRSVRLVEGNLAADDPRQWHPAGFDVIFCRNVLMYFTPEASRAALARLTGALAPGGYLFLGHAETLRSLGGEPGGDLQVRHTHEAFYYQRSGSGSPLTPSAADWVLAIDRAARRIRSVDRRRESLVPVPSVVETAPAQVWDRAFDLLRAERFAEALRVVEDAPAHVWRSRANEAALLHAVLLAQDGQLDRAEAVCRRQLAADGLDTGAYFLLGACREALGDVGGAIDGYGTSAYLDPGFAMPRLRLGLLARQRGDAAAARRDLRRALTLLAHEDPVRLLLFGGGFTGNALADLCRAELASFGGAP